VLYGVSFGGEAVASSAREFRGVTRGCFMVTEACSGAGAVGALVIGGALSVEAAIPLFRALFLLGGMTIKCSCKVGLCWNNN